jgi:membrane associated rhomboid family serine protease
MIGWTAALAGTAAGLISVTVLAAQRWLKTK